MQTSTPFRLTLLALALSLAGCAVGPAYVRPEAPPSAAFKELDGWVPAAPADALERGPWWQLFGDPLLDELVAGVEVSNQNVAAASANYAQARAAVAQQRAALFPTVSLNLSGDRSGVRSQGADNSYRLNLGGSWEPDVWGRLRAGVASAQAGLEASAADLASARLSSQGELASNYFTIRALDAQSALLSRTIAGYERELQITQNRFNVGIAARTDVLQAQTQLASARSDALTLARQRAQFEHAIAILVGKAPSEFTLAASPEWRVTVPEVPVGVPATLLQRRPDIAAAERDVAAANAEIGIARAAYFPNIGLSGSLGSGGSRVGDLFSASNAAWSFGLSAAQSIFNAGAIRASVAGAEARQQAAVARYRQTVLNAFADVEDQLSATRVLAQQQELRRQASEAADLVEQQIMNRYRAGQVGYTEVVQAQVTALNARRNLVQVQSDRQTVAVALIQSLGGGWQAGAAP
ncbi:MULTISPECIES: efflux transporter outer membrane subunit [unclassified Massilia]|uniref:efflux transporter outer membrane subunit n=1 Tax=unclassified Massilia TaxID=2609279 RepID=UPI001781CEE8|nr:MULTISPECIES: efflux transporter outer membrane subunit [unclassified Massilia]MBD8532451.1 efflux transporter outer membrane subunit [Massilia sp. CFBP 13647]MBD8675821.1 efflux transporter outer membrane subunit [Massilia sp. CFBP 13721]